MPEDLRHGHRPFGTSEHQERRRAVLDTTGYAEPREAARLLTAKELLPVRAKLKLELRQHGSFLSGATAKSNAPHRLHWMERAAPASRRSTQEHDDLPFVSVIIPCRNEIDHIATCVRSLAYGTYPKDRLEILVLDGMSDDGTRPILEQLAREIAELRVIDNQSRRIPTALNLGLQHSRGELIARADAHAVYATTYVAACVAALRDFGADCVGGYMGTRQADKGWIARTITEVWTSPFGVGNSAPKLTGPEASPRRVDTVFGGCYRRSVFDRIGGWDDRLLASEDLEFNSRLRRAGGQIVLAPDIR